MIAAVDCLDLSATPPADQPAPARRGGGPKTPEGKAASSRNALKHGLRATSQLPDELADAVETRKAAFTAEFQPTTPYEEFLISEMARESCKLDRCAELAMIDLGRVVDRALNRWDEDRRLAAEELGAKLPKDPATISRALRRTRQGTDWLIERWEALGQILQANGCWTEEQRRLACDMTGVPVDLRASTYRVPAADDAPALAKLVEREVTRLREDCEAVLDALDDAERDMATAGMPLYEDAATARLRRYEARCRRALGWARAELRRGREGDGPEKKPARKSTGEAEAIYLAKRSMAAVEREAEAAANHFREAQAQLTPKAPAPAAVKGNPDAAPRMVPSARPAPVGNRRERRAQAKRDRQAARRGS